MTRSEKGLILILAAVGVFSFFYFRGLIIQNKIWDAEAKKQELLGNIYSDSFGGISLIAKSAIVYDPAAKESIFSLHENLPAPMASVTKVMTAIVALEEMPAATIVPISKEALLQEGDTGLFVGEKWKLPDLVAFMLVVSSNDAAHAIALAEGNDSSAFIEAMNKKAADLGLGRTRFSNETGLDIDAATAGSYSSAYDIARMISYAYLNHRDIFSETSKPEGHFVSESGFSHNVKNTDDLAGSLEGILASKTGYTTLAGGNLAVVFKTPSGRILSAVVLGSTIDGRFKDMEKLISASSKYVNDIILSSDGKNTSQN
jgi:D-alanyl-D-alanine carboxypeptidase (penicillin-binding protein 5/6)